MRIFIDYTDVSEHNVVDGSTVGQVLQDRNIQAQVGFNPSRVIALVRGNQVGNDTRLTDGTTLQLEDRASEKA